MTSLSFEPTRESAGRSIAFGSTDTSSGYLSWSVQLSEDDHVNLTTGGRLRDVKGKVQMRPGTATPEGRETYGSKEHSVIRWGHLVYREPFKDDEWSFPANVTIFLHPSQAVYDEVLHSIRAGMHPSVNIKIFEDFGLVDFKKHQEEERQAGWESDDADGYTWDTKNHRGLDIKGCTFNFDYGPPPKAEDDDGKPLPTIDELVAHGFKDVKDGLKKLQWAIWLGIALLVLILGSHR